MALLSLVVLFAPRSPAGPGWPAQDKAVHLLLFAALAGTARWRFGGRTAVAAALVAYALGSELLQAFVLPERSGDLLDVVADLTGAMLGWVVARRLSAAR